MIFLKKQISAEDGYGMITTGDQPRMEIVTKKV